MTRLTLLLPILLLALLVGNPAFTADFLKGYAAYKSGDYATALREFRPLAEQGNAGAQNNLGVMYEKGQGVYQNDKTALKWYRLAAEQGDAGAQYNLGWMYRRGRGVSQNYKTAVEWYRFAAEQGVADAQTSLGVMYGKGRGVPQDYVRAHMWYNLAASQGDKDATENRDIVAKKMSPVDISKAQDLARDCVQRNYKSC